MAVTSSANRMGVFFPKKILDQFVLPAVQSDGPLPANVSAYEELKRISGPPKLMQEPQPISALPAVAMKISGKTYSLEKNNWNYNNFKLVFNHDQAEISYTAKEEDRATFVVGLDGVYHFTETEIGCVAAFGGWTTPDTFEINSQQIGYTATTRFVLTFKGDEIEVTEVGQTGSTSFSGKVKQN